MASKNVPGAVGATHPADEQSRALPDLKAARAALATITTATGSPISGDLARVGALISSAEQLAPELEQLVTADGFAYVTAIEALLESARATLNSAMNALEGGKAHV